MLAFGMTSSKSTISTVEEMPHMQSLVAQLRCGSCRQFVGRHHVKPLVTSIAKRILSKFSKQQVLLVKRRILCQSLKRLCQVSIGFTYDYAQQTKDTQGSFLRLLVLLASLVSAYLHGCTTAQTSSALCLLYAQPTQASLQDTWINW